MANINKIKLSGTTYNIQDENATKTVELTQAQYDALTVKDPNTFYIITDAQGADLSNYYTKSETSSATEISTALGNKQDTLVSGTNIKTINNESILGSGNITIEGGGGGKAIEAGRGISITTGETADTVSFNLPISAMTGTNIMYGGTNNSVSITGGSSNYNNFFGSGNTISVSGITSTNATSNIVLGASNSVDLRGSKEAWQYSLIIGVGNSVSHSTYMGGAAAFNIICGSQNTIGSNISDCLVMGFYNNPKKAFNTNIGQFLNTNNDLEFAHAKYNVSSYASATFGNSGNTLFSVGNGTSDSSRHNAFEIRQNGDIYIPDTNDTSTANYYEKPMIKLQDALGGAVDTEITSASTNPVTSAAIYNQLGGLKLVKLSQSAYDALATKDSNTLYVIEEAPECNTPQGATYHAVDDNFDKTTQVYGIDFSNYDALNNEPTTFTVDLNSANNIEYTVDVNTNNAEPYFTTTVTRGTETVYTADVAGFNFCEVFGEPMYISAFPSYETCTNEVCTEYECMQYDEETGECIEQSDTCISTECLETQTNYPMTALY